MNNPETFALYCWGYGATKRLTFATAAEREAAAVSLRRQGFHLTTETTSEVTGQQVAGMDSTMGALS